MNVRKRCFARTPASPPCTLRNETLRGVTFVGVTLEEIMASTHRKSSWARYTLASIRLVNGVLGLGAPDLLTRRLATDPQTSPAAIYAFRLFGIRTILLAAELFALRGDELQRALREGVLIHASDAVTAAALGVRGQVPRSVAALTTAISTANVALALASLEDE
jgi:hypothetical protein